MSAPGELGGTRLPLRRLDLAVTGVLFVVAAVAASHASAHGIFPIGDWRGVGRRDVAAGCLLGGFGGGWVWRHGFSLDVVPRVIAALAAASALAAVPAQVHQSLHLTSHYAGVGDTTAERVGGSQVPSVGGRTEVFDRLRDAIPPDETYALYADWAFALWAHTWLLPRVDLEDQENADWAIFHYRSPAKSGLPLTNVRKVGPGTWIARVAR